MSRLLVAGWLTIGGILCINRLCHDLLIRRPKVGSWPQVEQKWAQSNWKAGGTIELLFCVVLLLSRCGWVQPALSPLRSTLHQHCGLILLPLQRGLHPGSVCMSGLRWGLPLLHMKTLLILEPYFTLHFGLGIGFQTMSDQCYLHRRLLCRFQIEQTHGSSEPCIINLSPLTPPLPPWRKGKEKHKCVYVCMCVCVYVCMCVSRVRNSWQQTIPTLEFLLLGWWCHPWLSW